MIVTLRKLLELFFTVWLVALNLYLLFEWAIAPHPLADNQSVDLAARGLALVVGIAFGLGLNDG